MNTVNKKNQSQVNKTVKALISYNEANRTRERFDNDYDTSEKSNERQFERLNKICENKWDKYSTYLNELPKYLQKQIENSDLYLLS